MPALIEKNIKPICDNICVKDNTLYFANQNVTELAEKYGTPLYLMDEDKIRANCRRIKNAMNKNFGDKSEVLFASKACCFKKIYGIMADENMFCDCVSCGEIYTALSAGFKAEHILFHSNNKTDEDICFAVDNGVYALVCDCKEELERASEIALEKGKAQNVLIRLTPGIDPHTFEAVATGKIDSKFGFGIQTGAGEEAVKLALELKGIRLLGFHCHLGSQIFESDVYLQGMDIMVGFISDMQRKYGYKTEILDIGGGFGVRYTVEDAEIDIPEMVDEIGDKIHSLVKKHGIEMPRIFTEPGRSIVADAGMTLYTVGSVKDIPEYRTYVSIDGGMTDNVRYAMYQSKYTFYNASRVSTDRSMKCTVAGRCCESGDLLGEGVLLPEETKRGDILAVATTGAYNYSMSSNYNRIPKPPIVMLKDGESYTAVKRQSYEDMMTLEL
ncbi:MAG: diaminopimelate decarboxylase [Clostridia bacterium]|nr:diaminopimelate decarboxylase [Clostridia bacterium]